MLPPSENEPRDRPAVQIIEPAAGKDVTSRSEILDLWREVKFTCKPGLHGVLIGRAHIHQMSGHERPYMARHNFLRDQVRCRFARMEGVRGQNNDK